MKRENCEILTTSLLCQFDKVAANMIEGGANATIKFPEGDEYLVTAEFSHGVVKYIGFEQIKDIEKAS